MTDDNPATGPVEDSQDLVRLRRAYQIACMNLTELNDQRQKLVNALDGAMQLVNQLLMEMRNNGVVPSPQIISFKAGFDKGMRELLGRDKGD
jgi:hypothetical protein